MKIKNIFTVLLVAFILASCAPAVKIIPTETALPTSTFMPVPTATSTATPIPIIPKEQFTKGFLEIAQPTQDLIEKGIETGIIRQAIDVNELTFDVHDNLNKSGEQIVFGRTPETQEIILATRVNLETGEMVWHVAGLRDIADATGLMMGTSFARPYFPDELRAKLDKTIAQEFNLAIIEGVHWWNTEKRQGEFTFSDLDIAVANARSNRMYVDMDNIIYVNDFQYSYLQDYTQKLVDSGVSRADIRKNLTEIMVNHITQVVGHYEGQVDRWRLIEEFRPNPKNPSEDQWAWWVGNDYPDIAAAAKNAIDPTTPAMVGDGHNETRSGPFSWNYQSTKDVATRLNINGKTVAGLQMNPLDVANPPFTFESLVETIKSYEIEVVISSLAPSMANVTGTQAEREKVQGDVTAMVIRACLAAQNCHEVDFWEFYTEPEYSWLKDPNGQQSLFDLYQKPRDSYFIVKQELTDQLSKLP